MHEIVLRSESPIIGTVAVGADYPERVWIPSDDLELALAGVAIDSWNDKLGLLILNKKKAWYRKLVALAVKLYPIAPLQDLEEIRASIAFAWMSEHAFRDVWQDPTQVGGQHPKTVYVVMPDRGKDRHGFISWMRQRGLLEDLESRLYGKGSL